MGLNIIRTDSVKDRRKKTVAELQAENEELRSRVEALEGQSGAAQALDVLLGEVNEDGQ